MRYAEALKLEHDLAGQFKGHTFSGFTGTMAAALAAGSTVGAVRYPVAATNKCGLKWMHLHYACIGSFTNPVTAGRRLALKRGSGGDPSGGTDLDITRDQSDVSTETLLTGQIATTTGLTMTSVTYETPVRARMLLTTFGSSGLDYDEIWIFDDPYILLPGQLAGIVAPAQFDAAGTWQLNWKGGAVEIPLHS